MALIVLIHALVFLAFWLSNLSYQETLNNFLIGMTGLKANFLLILMIFAGLVALWSAARLALYRHARKAGPSSRYLGVEIFFLVFFYGSFAFLFLKNPAQLYRLGQMFQYFRLFVDAGILLLLAWGLRRWVKMDRPARKYLLPAGLLVLWLIPILVPPGNVYRGTLPDKPRLIAHRGAATLAPENTLAAMQAAADLGVYGVETDLSVSIDGVLFMMHDSNLSRTTNVASLFSGRKNDLAETFTWDELSRLDAGSWFDRRAAFWGEAIPSLNGLVKIIRENDLYFIYDLRIPADGHPYASRAFDMCLEAIEAAGITDHVWVLATPDEVASIRSAHPNAILAAGIGYTDAPPTPASLVADGYRMVNSVYSLADRMIRAYRAAGLWVNAWVVDEPWQYSRLWLAGADSVTSNQPQHLLSMQHPLLVLPYGTYLLIWGLLGIIAAGVFWRALIREHARQRPLQPA